MSQTNQHPEKLGLSSLDWLIKSESFSAGFLEEHEFLTQGYSTQAILKDLLELQIKLLRKYTQSDTELLWFLSNWDDLVTAYFNRNIPADPSTSRIVAAVCDQLYGYLYTNLSTHLGEVMVGDIDLAQSKNTFAEIAQSHPQTIRLIGEYGLRQRIFDFHMDAETLSRLLASVQGVLGISVNEREHVEAQNLRIMHKLFALGVQRLDNVNPDLSLRNKAFTLLEVSPPAYSFQTELMVRFHYLSSSGWHTTQLSLPVVPNMDKLEEALSQIGKRLPARKRWQESGNEMLSRMLVFKEQNLDAVIERFFTAYAGAGGLSLNREDLQQNDSLIRDNLQSVMQLVNSLLVRLISSSVLSQTDVTEMTELAKIYNQVIDAAVISVKPQDELEKVGIDPEKTEEIRNPKLVVAATNGVLHQHLGGIIPAGRSLPVETNSACSRTNRNYNGGDLVATSESTTNPLPQAIVFTGNKGPETVNWRNVNNAVVLERCPVCGLPDLNPCAKVCSGCGYNVSTIYKAYKSNSLARLQEAHSQRHPGNTTSATENLSPAPPLPRYHKPQWVFLLTLVFPFLNWEDTHAVES